MSAEFLTVEETAHALGVSSRHARRLADAGAVTRIARGLVDAGSVDRYLRSQRQGRTRAWAEHTAWAAVALLSGREPGWLGASQASRLRASLREMGAADELITRMRDRAVVTVYAAHRAAVPRLRSQLASTDLGLLGLADRVDDSVDGYLAEADVPDLVRTLGLRADGRGSVVLRTTTFDHEHVRDLVVTSTVAALDASTSADPRLRGVGRRTLGTLLDSYR